MVPNGKVEGSSTADGPNESGNTSSTATNSNKFDHKHFNDCLSGKKFEKRVDLKMISDGG